MWCGWIVRISISDVKRADAERSNTQLFAGLSPTSIPERSVSSENGAGGQPDLVLESWASQPTLAGIDFGPNPRACETVR